MSDPVAEKSGFLRLYMSGHPDTLVAYSKWYGKVTESITSAELTSIDSRSMTLTCSMKGKTVRVINVRFDPPLASYQDVKPRLLEMKAIAQEGLGMLKTPELKSFYFPRPILKTLAPFVIIPYLTFFPRYSSSPIFEPGRLLFSFVGGDLPMMVLFNFANVTHIAECFYTFHLCRKYRTGFFLGSAYVFLTLLFGFPVWKEMQRQVQMMRIESVMKVE
ncbi:hypothetical protein HGRIS_010873 [Hohenbuehelia grisea]|uniref:DUF2470 domain-containing protein n=1 Tax=Hohenbuehelia grisea TaxID=104357 RepID=A0ABR3IYW8_9AGAR